MFFVFSIIFDHFCVILFLAFFIIFCAKMETLPNHESPNGNIDDSTGCDRHCSNCNTTVTPLWRKFGPVKFLCNACGLYYKVNGDHRPYYMSKNKLNSSSKKLMLRCANCGTNKTTMWRKNGGTHVCNACGLYFRINGHNRSVFLIFKNVLELFFLILFDFYCFFFLHVQAGYNAQRHYSSPSTARHCLRYA